MPRLPLPAFFALALLATACSSLPTAAPAHDVVLRGGTVYDGSGGEPYVADVAIDGDRITAIGAVAGRGRLEIDAGALAVAPGFVNMLSWADESLLLDGRSLSDVHQGVTLEVFGEGWSMGPLTPEMKERIVSRQSEDWRFDVPWTTLGEYLAHLEARGVSTHVASFVGATTVRIHELGYEDRAPTPEELERMRALVREAMEEGAMGLGSSLPYSPAAFASTDELVALAEVVAEVDGLYVSHIRNEGSRLLEALEEFLEIVRRSGVRGEVYHLKASGVANWPKLDRAIERIEAARAAGLSVTADVYPYAASSTGLNYDIPAWVKEGGHEAFVARLRDPETRARVEAETRLIPPEDILLVSFRNPDLRHLTGRTLAEVAAERGTSPVATAIDLILEDDSRIGTVRFTMSEANVAKKIALPWVSFCSDAASIAPEPPFTDAQPHPRAYGSFARVLGKYVREEGVLTLAEAVRRLAALPAENLRLERRGRLVPGFYADVVVFDPKRVIDRATFEEPHQLAEGVLHVFVDGVRVLADGEHTGATPGRFVRGPGWVGER